MNRGPRHFHVAKPVGSDRWGHPTAIPVQLLRRLVRLATPPGEWVLDPFAGCASVGEAALQEGFNYAGIELNPIYAETARKRLKHVAGVQSRQEVDENILKVRKGKL